MRMPPNATIRCVVATASLGLVLTACASPKNDQNSSGTTPGTNATQDTNDGGSSGGSDTGNDPSIATTNASMTGPSDGSGTDGGSTSISFIQDPDGGGVNIECDIWAQDCPDGEKCMPWANDGGNSWNATRCSPLDPNPGQPGDACTVEGCGVSGIDNCDIGLDVLERRPRDQHGHLRRRSAGQRGEPGLRGPEHRAARSPTRAR